MDGENFGESPPSVPLPCPPQTEAERSGDEDPALPANLLNLRGAFTYALLRIRNLLDGIHRTLEVLRYDRDNQRLLREYAELKRQGK